MTDLSRQPSRPVATRRLRLALLVGAALWGGVAARLIKVQAVDHEIYAQRARAQQERPVPIHVRRGEILDREGRELALDVAAVSFYARPGAVRDPDGVAAHFGALVRRDPEDLRRLLEGKRPFVYLLRQAHDDVLERARAQHFAGVHEEEGVRRYYPYGRLAGQILGFTDIDNQGREGVELSFDDRLAEQSGEARSFIDSRGRVLPDRSEATAPARPGANVQLTLDVVIQGILEDELGRAVQDAEAESGLGIVADPRTGDVLALASLPLFDPNDPGASPAAHRRNRLITDPFEPGSTLKPITMAAVLDAGVPADTTVFCEQGAFELATGDTLRDSKAHGWLTASEVMSESSNIGTMKLARRLERGQFYESLRSFGFGTRTGVSLPAESAGLLRHARDWSDRSLETIAIGQEISVTALQMVQAFGAIANGGTLMAPRLVDRVLADDGTVLEHDTPQTVRRVITPETATVLQDMLRRVVTEGTGRQAAIAGMPVAGKTGTAQRALPGGGGYAPDEYVASFVGFLPATSAPRYVCLIVVENPRVGKYGGAVAAPAFRRTMERVLALDGTLSPTPEGVRAPSAQPERLPDLRGLSLARARKQAARRGLQLHFVGEGALVVEQRPLPPALRGDGEVIICRLGDAVDGLPWPALRGAPLRQAALMRKLVTDRRLVALVP